MAIDTHSTLSYFHPPPFRSLGSAATPGTRPVVALAIETPLDMCDVNVTPDKRKVVMQAEGEFLTAMQAVRGEDGEGVR